VEVGEKEGRETSSPCHIWFFDTSAKLALFSFKMSNYRTWQSKQAFHHHIMVLPFIADSNFKLKTTLYSTKNFSFLHACISYGRSPCNICTVSSTLDVTRTLGSSLFFTKNFLYSIKNFSLFICMHICGTSPSNICTNSSTLDVTRTLWVQAFLY
jgi:hypothetical protein